MRKPSTCSTTCARSSTDAFVWAHQQGHGATQPIEWTSPSSEFMHSSSPANWNDQVQFPPIQRALQRLAHCWTPSSSPSLNLPSCLWALQWCNLQMTSVLVTTVAHNTHTTNNRKLFLVIIQQATWKVEVLVVVSSSTDPSAAVPESGVWLLQRFKDCKME